jgi:hypothetical protein
VKLRIAKITRPIINASITMLEKLGIAMIPKVAIIQRANSAMAICLNGVGSIPIAHKIIPKISTS